MILIAAYVFGSFGLIIYSNYDNTYVFNLIMHKKFYLALLNINVCLIGFEVVNNLYSSF